MKVVRALISGAIVLVLLGAIGAWVFVRGLAQPAPLGAPERHRLVLDDVVLVEPGLSRAPHRRLVVEGSEIREIAGAEDSSEFAGMFVLPGLVDAHAHFPPSWLPGQVELWAYLFLRHGVTGIRVPADVAPGTSSWANDQIEAGTFAGPRVSTCGRFIDGPNPVFASAIVVTTAEEARTAVEEVAAAGYDCVKAYNELDATTLGAIREAAAEHGLPVIGHVPWRLSLEEARLDDVQHQFGFHARTSADPFGDLDDRLVLPDERVDQVIEALLRDDAAMTTTLVTRDRMSRAREISRNPDDPMRRWLPPWYADALWRVPGGINPANRMTDEELVKLGRVNRNLAEAVPKLHAAGVRLRAGTDTFAPPIVPGVSLHEELALLVSGGLTTEEALAIATRGNAEALPVPGLGRLRPGAPADLAIYREDPTVDLAALDSLVAVVQDGRLYTRDMFDAQDARLAESYAGAFHGSVMPAVLRAGLDLLLGLAFAQGEDPPH